MHILLAEDDELLADGLAAQLQAAHFQVEIAPNGAVADYLLTRQTFDLAILDIGLPMLDGLSVLRSVRRSRPDLPVLLLTARDSLDDRVLGLQAGADDYVTKPFDFPELEARIRALLRRAQPRAGALQLGDVVLDQDTRRMTVAGEAVDLSGREWSLLQLLSDNAGEVISKEQINQAWTQDGGEAGLGNSIEVYVHRLRRKLSGSNVGIRTVRGIGYLLELPQALGRSART